MVPRDVDWLESLLEVRYGLTPSNSQRENLTKWLGKGRVKRSASRSEHAASLRDLIDHLVVGETYFFREVAQIEHCVRRALPELALAKVSSRRLRILSAGCSSGEEAYSLAIAADVHGNNSGEEVSIIGVDVSASAIKKAVRGQYSAWSLRATPPDIRDSCFRKRGNEYEIDARFRARVRFEERNLFDPDPDFWAPGAFDVVFCRNVTIYFSVRAMKDLMQRFASILAPGGFLYLGHSESLRGISDDFENIHEGCVFCYRRSGQRRSSAPYFGPPPVVETPLFQQPELPRPAPALIENFLSTISVPVVPPPAPPPVHVPREWDREKVLSLIELERFDEALAVLDTMPTSAETELYRAVVSSARGQFRDVESTCRMLLAHRQYEPESHHLLALCHSHERDFDAAEIHYREAARQDATFAMPRLQFGLLLARSGDPKRARIELEAAMALLPNERRDRLAFFSGGFSRDALILLCRTSLGQSIT